MALGPVRPRFHLQLTVDPEMGLARAESAVAAAPDHAVCRVVNGHIDIAIARASRHRFSPCLQLEFNPRDESSPTRVRSVVHGLVGPHPNLWTLYAFAALGCVTLLLFCGIFGGVQLALSEMPWGFWGIPLSAAGLLGLYGISQYGQRSAAAQTRFLYDLVHDALDDVTHHDGGAASSE